MAIFSLNRMMMKNLLTYKNLSICLFVLSMSCTKDVDFNQIDDLEINPVLESSIIYFNAPATNFYNNGEISVSQDFVLLDIFNNKLTVDDLTKAAFTFESINSINRAFQLDIDFIDSNDDTQYSIMLLAPQSINNQDIITEQLVVFEDDDLVALKRTVKLVFTITLQSGEPIDDNTLGDITLKSKGLFYFTIDNFL